jgi:hypothetical protein
MTLIDDLAHWKNDRFIALILDNEVTVGEFLTDPPLPWRRIVHDAGAIRVADGYPNQLTAAQAKFEMTNWDQVSLPAIARFLAESGGLMDYVIFGNNAGQGLPLAQALPKDVISNRAAVIYATSLPEKTAYERLGYGSFWRRSETTPRLLKLAKDAGRSLSLLFINTIQHNELNYHDP